MWDADRTGVGPPLDGRLYLSIPVNVDTEFGVGGYDPEVTSSLAFREAGSALGSRLIGIRSVIRVGWPRIRAMMERPSPVAK